MFLAPLTVCLLLSPVPPQEDLPRTPEERRAAVERSLIPSSWVEGHELDIRSRMKDLNIPGASVAVIHDGKIDWVAGYGVRSLGGSDPVTPDTLFQAASISKPVSGLAVMRFAQEGRLDLDAPINSLLTSWKLADGGFEGEVTPAHLMSHTGGLNVHGFPGYKTYDPRPSAVQVLDGAGPTNTDAVRRVALPGRGVTYSGGGSTVLQVALQDLTGRGFAPLMQDTVLGPLGMTRSTFLQPLPTERFPDHAHAHNWGGRRTLGDFHVYPEQYPAGLWTTPGDLARFALAIQASLAGEEGAILDVAQARRMVTPVLGNSTLGFFIELHDGEPWFGHGGSNEGFKCLFRASVEGGRGFAVMTNGDQGIVLANDLLRAVARVYEWPGVVPPPIPVAAGDPVPLEAYVGRYGHGPDAVTHVDLEGERLVFRQGLERPYFMAPLGDHTFLLLGTDTRVTFDAVRGNEAPGFRSSTDRSQHALRLTEEERWPLDDLLAGDPRDAIDFYREVHSENPEDPMVDLDRLHDLGVNLCNYGAVDAGLAVVELVAELNPSHAGVHDSLGELYLGAERPGDARRAYERCLELEPDDPTLDAADHAWMRARAESRLRGLRP